MFTCEERERLRSDLIEVARRDPRVTGAAITGSASLGGGDRWSDIDLAFGVDQGSSVREVLADFSQTMYAEYGAIHHLDVPSGAWIYRVFLLPSTLQVDLAFAPASEFGARAPTFRLVFGSAIDQPHPAATEVEVLIGWAWLYALHARSSLCRGRPWQAEYMISGMRDQVAALACIRHGLPARDARGVDDLPADVTRSLRDALVCDLDIDELRRAFQAAIGLLVDEAAAAAHAVAARLRRTLYDLTEGLDLRDIKS